MKSRLMSFLFAAIIATAASLAIAQAQEPVPPQPPERPEPQEPRQQPPVAEASQTKDIVETASENGHFSTLLKAIEAAGLTDTLKGSGPFTIFAPTDEAFAKLPAEQLDALMKDKAALKKVLLGHVVSGTVMAKDAARLPSATSAEGATLKIKSEGDKVMVENATVVEADILAANGVIHAVDTVILPPSVASGK